jgi:hypothetical protein
MPPTAPNFAQAFIYKITAPETQDVYVGSATTNLNLRRAQHKNHYDRWLRGEGKYLSSFHVIDCSGWKLEKIEDFPCETSEELRVREGYWIQNTAGACNLKIAGRTHNEYKALPEVKKKEAIQRKKRYASDENLRAKKKDYYEKHKDKKKEYARKYYEEHREYFRDYMKNYSGAKKRIVAAENTRAEVTQEQVNQFFTQSKN